MLKPSELGLLNLSASTSPINFEVFWLCWTHTDALGAVGLREHANKNQDRHSFTKPDKNEN